MGSAETKEYEMPESAYTDISNNRSNVRTTTSMDVATQHDAPSNLTIRQQQSINAERRAQKIVHLLSSKETNSSPVVTSTKLCHYYDAKQIPVIDKMRTDTKTPDLVKIRTDAKTPVVEKICTDTKIPNPLIRRKTTVKSIIKPPNKLNDLDDFIQNWNIWKEQLISFLILTDEKKDNYHQWGNIFLHFMGPFGQEILNELFFNEGKYKKDYDMLLQKYDLFYKFHTTVKSKSGSTVKYIEKLQGDVAQNFKNVDITVKYKIAREIKKHCKERFVALAKSKLPKFQFETTFNILTLAEIAFLWENCEESNSNNNGICICCGKFHQEGNCPAFNKECNLCKKRNHFSNCCPGRMYITNCSFCGGNHRYKNCSAYGETCSKCERLNHFSWKCSKEITLNCRYCGLSHSLDRRTCPAKHSLCSICRERGHYDTKCTKIQHVTNKLEID